VVLVVSRPDRRRGRNAAPSPSPVKAAARDLGVAVTDRVDDVLDAGADLGVVVAFGQLLRPPVLGSLPLVNLHFSLLPRWRGAAPVERAILAGDERTGVCLMAIEAGLDTGGVYRRVATDIGPDETAVDLRTRLALLGRDLLLAALDDGLGEPVAQAGDPTYAPKLDPADLHLDWSQPATALHRVVRVGRAWTTVKGKRLLVLAARAAEGDGPGAPGHLEGTVVTTGSGRLTLVTVQPEGRRPSDAGAWLRGVRGVTALGT
jgi:methionyl-tRNA formyltransferase